MSDELTEPASPQEAPTNTYKPERYLWHQLGEEGDAANLCTVMYLLPWADSYVVGSSLLDRKQDHKGILPPDLAERHKLVNLEFARLSTQTGYTNMITFTLLREGIPLLDQYDGSPGDLNLTEYEFSQLQNEWELKGFPRELYYKLGEETVVIEPTQIHSGVVLMRHSYSPLEWKHRIVDETLKVPSQEERTAAFAEACETYFKVLILRLHELNELGRTPNKKEVKLIAILSTAVVRLAQKAEGDIEALDKIIKDLSQFDKT